MGKMKDLFPEFYQDSLEVSDFAENDKPNLVIFDSNFLLDILRLPTEVAKKYLEAIDKVKGHIFIPYLVGVEFNFNKKKVKIETTESIKLLKESLNKSFEDNYQQFFENWNNKLLDKTSLLFLKNKAQRESLQKSFEESAAKFSQGVENLKEQMFSELDKSIEAKYTEELDELTKEIIRLLGNSVADKLEQEWLNKVQEAGNKRFENEMPPGFNDRKTKENKIRYYSNFSYDQQYGDYIIWEEILHKVARDGTDFGRKIIFVTSDGNSDSKNDIMYKVKGKTVGPNIHMVNELYDLNYGYDILSDPTPSTQKTKKNLYVIDGFRFMSLANKLNKDEAKLYQPETAGVDFHQTSRFELDKAEQYSRFKLEVINRDLEQLEKKFNEIRFAYGESRDVEQRNYFEQQLEEINSQRIEMLNYRNRIAHSVERPYIDDRVEAETYKERILAEQHKVDRLWVRIEEIEKELGMTTNPELISELEFRRESLIERYKFANRKIRRMRRRLNEN